MRRIWLALTIAMLFASAASGLDVKDGRIRLVVDERSGGFALYYLADVARNRYVPLIYDQETRTTYCTLVVDQKPYKLGDSSDFRVSVVREASGGVRIEYRSSFCVVKQTFSFVASPGSSMSDGVNVEFGIENVAQKDASIGLRMLVDTWLGEKSSAHFSTQTAGALAGETALAGDFADAWIRSSENDDGASPATSLQVQLSSPATRPDRLIVANWKRLNDASWAFDANPSRNFTLLPYSINDSALALYYEPSVIRPGSTRTIAAILSQANDGYPATVQATPAPGSLTAAVAAPLVTAPLDEMVDLVAIRSVLEAINTAIASGTVPTAEEMAAMEAVLRQLESRKAKY